MKNKKNLKGIALVVLGMLLGHFAMDIVKIGIKDGKEHVHQVNPK